jgi:HK97 gp10 family phage protein
MARSYSARAKKVKAKVEGAEEIIKLLKEMGQNAENVLSQAAEAGGKIALSDAKRRCPVGKTGNLKSNLKLETGKKTSTKAFVKVLPGKDEYYGTFVELGTKKQPAQPFLRPAVDENKEKISEKVTSELSRAVGKAR